MSSKFYELPLEIPNDRHKWFFSSEEAEYFVIYTAAQKEMPILHIDRSVMGTAGHGYRRLLRTFARTVLLKGDLSTKNLYPGTLWVVLEK